MGYTSSTVHGIPVPDSSQANNIPTDLTGIVNVLETGSLVKRLSQTTINALSAGQKPAGLVVYNTTTSKLQVSNGSTFANVTADSVPTTSIQRGYITVSGSSGTLTFSPAFATQPIVVATPVNGGVTARHVTLTATTTTGFTYITNVDNGSFIAWIAVI